MSPKTFCWIALALLSCPAIAPAQPIVAAPGYRLNGSGNWITAGPDGALWFTDSNSTSIGRIHADGVAVEYQVPIAGCNPWEITTGPDGALWFTELGGCFTCAINIGRITTNGVITGYPVTPGTAPLGIAAGPDGAL